MSFEPSRPDGRSYRTVALDVLKELKPGDVVSYETLAEKLDLDPSQRTKIGMAVRAANRTLLRMFQRGVQVAPNLGYRMLPAREHVVVANGYRGKAARAITRSADVLNGANLAEMTAAERRLHEGQQMIVVALAAAHREYDRRFSEHERNFTILKERLDRHGLD